MKKEEAIKRPNQRAVTRAWLTLPLVLIEVLWGCGGSDNPTQPIDSTLDITRRCLITGNFGTALSENGAIEGFVTRSEVTDPSAMRATASVNGTSIPERAFLSTPETAVFALENFNYTAGAYYTVTVSLAGKTAASTFTAPASEYPTITAPADEGLFTPGNPLSVRWNYGGNNPDLVYVRVSPVNEEGDAYYEQELSGQSTSHEIGGTETATWTDTDVIITVDLGERANPFAGQLALPGSALATVLPGDAISARNAHGASNAAYSMHAVVDPPTLEANGSATAELTVSIFDDQYSQPCPDGTTLMATMQPEGLVTLAPANLTTAAEISLVPPSGGDVQISVGTGAHPPISWTPASEMASVIIAEAALGQGNPAWSIARRVIGGSWITSPLTYGTLPAGSMQVVPTSGAPAPLTPGTEYRIWLVTSLGAVYTRSFTP